jgi:hypothetical protein
MNPVEQPLERGAGAAKWWQYSIGWRTNLRGGVGLLGEERSVIALVEG